MISLDEIRDLARELGPPAGVPAAVIVGQIVTETGWGRSPGRFGNLLGIKGTPLSPWSYRAQTPEVVRGGARIRGERWFRKFPGADEPARRRACVAHYCRLVTSGRYEAAREYRDDPARFLAYLWASYYASSLRYVETCVGVLRVVHERTGDPDCDIAIDDGLAASLDRLRAARVVHGASWGPLRRARDLEHEQRFGLGVVVAV